VKPIVTIDAGIDAQVRHLITRYVWALDVGDIATLETLFTEDCLVQDTSGARHEGRTAAMGYFTTLTRSAPFRGRRHHIDNLLYFAMSDEACHLRAYWTVDKWEVAGGRKVIEALGHSEDRFVRGPDGWRFAERLLHYWRDVDCPWVVDATGS
jgi:hypothetical protein